MNYKIITIAIALLFFACNTVLPEDIPSTIFANKEGIITEEAIIKQFNLENYTFLHSEYGPDDQGKVIVNAEKIHARDWSFKLMHKGSSTVEMLFYKKNTDSWLKKNQKKIIFFAVWQ